MGHFKFIRFLETALVTVLAGAGAASAADIPGYPEHIAAYDAREIALLPKYCKYTQSYRDHVPGGGDQAKQAYWYEVMGPTFHAMHHYCNGLMKTNRAMLLARKQQVRSYYLSSSILEFDYVIERAPADFVMLPEILTKKGENLLRLGRAGVGIESLERAIKLKPDYWPPYVAMSDYYKKSGDRAKARELLEEALSFAPDVKGLKNRLADLDAGKGKPR